MTAGVLLAMVVVSVSCKDPEKEKEKEKEKETENGKIETFTANGVSFDMVFVKGGTFTMGAPDTDTDAYEWEKPAHQVTVSDYSIAKFPVTQKLWQAVMGGNPSYLKGDNRPVETVSWDDAQAFISKLNAATGKKFRLPTEAQWEYAARGGSQSKNYKYSGSNNIDDVAWYYDNSVAHGKEHLDYGTHPVGTKKANELGICDMTGNVWEWCNDWYDIYTAASQTNPQGAAEGSFRVLRGGSWRSHAQYCRVAYRADITPSYRNADSGFRLSLVP
jgi:formylglycine-generating enzyme required for sulfatase activity